MTPCESQSFNNALDLFVSAYEMKVIKAILSGENNFDQEDIIRTSTEGIILLRKLGWLLKLKKAIKRAGLHLLENNRIII